VTRLILSDLLTMLKNLNSLKRFFKIDEIENLTNHLIDVFYTIEEIHPKIDENSMNIKVIIKK